MRLGGIIAALFLFLTAAAAAAQQPAIPAAPPPLTDQEMERFLLEAEVVKSRSAGMGVTGSERATLRQGSFTHDAHVQIIDEQKLQGPGPRGSSEFNFRDSWTYNVAAYRLDRLLALNLVPVSIERRWRGHPAAYTWWVDDVMMDEGRRLKKKVPPPSIEEWNQEMQLVRIFDQLIYNVDRNVGNLLITKSWRMWAIDHTRAFRTLHQLKTPKDIGRCERTLLERLKQLDKKTLTQELGRYLTNFEIDALLARRDAIVALVDKMGPGALFDRGRKTPVPSKP
jgi:hypothetical protein